MSILYGRVRQPDHLAGHVDDHHHLARLFQSYAMTGWRLGFGVMPLNLAEHIKRLVINSNSCTSASTVCGVGSAAGLTAVRASIGRVQAAARRDRRGAERHPGITCHKPLGAFYVFPTSRNEDDQPQCADFLMHGQVWHLSVGPLVRRARRRACACRATRWRISSRRWCNLEAARRWIGLSGMMRLTPSCGRQSLCTPRA